MDAITALHKRVSVARLAAPAPDPQTLEQIFTAALRAPDHAMLRPWRFLTIQGAAREALGELFLLAQQADNPALTEMQLQRAGAKPLRAPMIIVVVAVLTDHPKVPEIEQLLSAGAAAQNMLVAAHALGLGAIWRTGSMAYHPLVCEGLGLAANERVIGYLYLGQIEGKTRELPTHSVQDFVTQWPAE